jgi:hypothetical protein
MRNLAITAYVFTLCLILFSPIPVATLIRALPLVIGYYLGVYHGNGDSAYAQVAGLHY